MGRPSDKKRSARRPGKRERARVKSGWKSSFSTHVPGVGHVHVKAGRKKLRRALSWARKTHLSGNLLNPEAGRHS